MPIQPGTKAIHNPVHCPSLFISPPLHAHCQCTPPLWAAISLENSRRSHSLLSIFPLHLGVPPCAEWHLHHYREVTLHFSSLHEGWARFRKLKKPPGGKFPGRHDPVDQSKLFQILHSVIWTLFSACKLKTFMKFYVSMPMMNTEISDLQ